MPKFTYNPKERDQLDEDEKRLIEANDWIIGELSSASMQRANSARVFEKQLQSKL